MPASPNAPHAAPAVQAGALYVVGTPIGNLGDISSRALEVLRQADVLLCEDTRVTSRLLARFDIHVPLRRADENVLSSVVEPALARVEAGGRVAFVSDAGMPGVSDPGQRLVDAALERGLKVEVIPGPSAVTCALVASGLPMDHFFFEGFLPRKAGPMRARLEELAHVPGALVVYESPRRLAQTLGRVAQVFPTRRVAVLRELTKAHEECVRGLSGEVAAEFASRESIRGECVIVIAGPDGDERARQRAQLSGEGAGKVTQSLDEAIEQGLRAGEPKSALARRLARSFGLGRAEVYDAILARQGSFGESGGPRP